MFLIPKLLGDLRHVDSYSFEESVSYKQDAYRQQNKPSPMVDGQFTKEFLEECAAVDAEHVGNVLEALYTGKYHGPERTIKDFLKTSDYPKLFGAAAEIYLKDRIIPDRIVSDNLFQRIPYTGNRNQVIIRTFGGVQIEEIPEGGNYPETGSAVNDQAYRIALEIKKYGAKIAATRELIESDEWGILAYSLAQLGKEVYNYQERLCVTMINEMAGYTLKDNMDAANAELGSTTGRGIDGAQNGALGVDDTMEMMAWMQMRGYNVDTIMLHPFAWALWARDPEIREVMLNSNVVYMPSGSAAQGWDMPWGSLGQPWSRFGSGVPTTPTGNYPVDPIYGKLGVAPYNFPTLTPFGATYQITPKYMGRSLKVLVSPFVPFWKISSGAKAGKYATNIVFADSTKCGLILEKEAPTLEEWKDIEREIDFIKIRTRFGLALQEQGRAICVARNVVIDRTYAFENVNSRTLSALTTTSNLVTL